MRKSLTSRYLGATLLSIIICVVVVGAFSLLCIEPSTAWAQAADAAAAAPKEESFLVWLFHALGIKYVIAFLILSFLLIAFIFKYSLSMRTSVLMPDMVVLGFQDNIENKHFSEAYDLVCNDDSFMSQVLAAGMPRLQQGRDAAQKAMEDVIASESMKLDHQLSYVALIGTISPMIGLLGTVDGMVASFSVIASSPTTPKPSELATGISMALITTMVGLIMAIPAIIFFAIMKNHVNKVIFDISIKGEQFMDQLLRGGK